MKMMNNAQNGGSRALLGNHHTVRRSTGVAWHGGAGSRRVPTCRRAYPSSQARGDGWRNSPHQQKIPLYPGKCARAFFPRVCVCAVANTRLCLTGTYPHTDRGSFLSNICFMVIALHCISCSTGYGSPRFAAAARHKHPHVRPKPNKAL